jgi:CYTH domain-containing protein
MNETERKFLIAYPDREALLHREGATASEITQTYLLHPEGLSERVRQRVYADRTEYYHTVKRFLTAMTNEEKERTVTKEEYEELLTRQDPARAPIQKTRICIPHESHLLEIDLYPFWKKQAVLEVELEAEDTPLSLPPYLTVLREVTGEKAYKNRALALRIPAED